MNSLIDRLGLDRGGFVSLVGSGGKTSALFRLARLASARGTACAVAPSTKMYLPRIPAQVERIQLVTRQSGVPQRSLAGGVSAFGRAVEKGKLLGLPPDFLDLLWRYEKGSLILCEADGSRGLPLKVPRSREPVIPASTSLVLWVVGLHGLGKPFHEVVHGYGQVPGKIAAGRSVSGIVDEQMLGRILLDGGYLRSFPSCPVQLLFNRCRDKSDLGSAGRLYRSLRKRSLLVERGWCVFEDRMDQNWVELVP